jgi:ATP-dependent DNA helicase RecG
MYDSYVIREALHNCLAHQDYQRCERVVLIEYPEHLIFENGGSFIPGSVERVIEQNAPQKVYRNKFLAEAMVRLDMIDTIGSGIRRMFDTQRARFFPMPDYDLTEPQTVRLRIEGRILDRSYTQLLRDRPLSLEMVIWLDKVQKRKAHLLTDKQIAELKLAKLIEGRKPHYYVSLSVARQIGQEEDYARNRAFDDEQYKSMIVTYLENRGFATRIDIEQILSQWLSGLLTPQQRQAKISNLLTTLRMSGIITNIGSDKKPKWVLVTTIDKPKQM